MTPDASAAAEAAHQLRGWVDHEDFHYRMRNDHRWAAAVRFSCRAGIPLSVFFGRPQLEGEPLWLEHDTDTAIAFEHWSSKVCPSCGLHPLDWPTENAETWKGRIDVCFGCVEIADTRATIPADVSEAQRAAMHVYLVPRSELERGLLDAVAAGDIDPDDVPDFD